MPGGAGGAFSRARRNSTAASRRRGGPALRPAARVDAYPAAARRFGEEAGEAALALVVNRARQADRRAADSSGCQSEDLGDTPPSTRDRPGGDECVCFGGGRLGNLGVPGATTKGRSSLRAAIASPGWEPDRNFGPCARFDGETLKP